MFIQEATGYYHEDPLEILIAKPTRIMLHLIGYGVKEIALSYFPKFLSPLL